MELPDLHVLAMIRFHNREQITLTIPIERRVDNYIYCLLNEDFFKKEGILTYKVEMYSGDTVLDTWTHQLWTELIELCAEE